MVSSESLNEYNQSGDYEHEHEHDYEHEHEHEHREAEHEHDEEQNKRCRRASWKWFVDKWRESRLGSF